MMSVQVSGRMRLMANLAWVALVALLSGASSFAAELPYGHPDFQASRERPIGWRGNILGTFLGAAPPVEWNTGGEPITFYDAARKTVTLAPMHNVIWRTPMPNWASCGCIVVGKKVITRASPHTLLCYDADTGKKLWHNATDIWDYHFKNDLAKAKEMRQLCQKWDRQLFLGFGEQGKTRIRPWTVEEKNEWVKLTLDLLGTHPELFDKKTLADSSRRAKLDKARDGWWPSDPDEIAELMGFRVSWRPDLFLQYGVIANKYLNCLDSTISTPVSDGKYVYTASSFNLVCCYELATGTLRWMTWTGQPRGGQQGADYWPSPWIFADRLIVYNDYVLRGLDLDTGKELWRVPVLFPEMPDKPAQPRKNLVTFGHAHADNCAFLDVGGTKVIVTSTGHVVRAADGKVLSDGVLGFQFQANNTVVLWDDDRDMVFMQPGFGKGGGARGRDGKVMESSETQAWRLSLNGDGVLKTELVWSTPDRDVALGTGPVLSGGLVYGGKTTIDVLTGAVKARTRNGSNGNQGAVLTSGPRAWAITAADQPALADFKPSPRQVRECDEYNGSELTRSNAGSLVAGDKPFFVENPAAPVRTWARQALADGVISWLNAPPNDTAWMNHDYGAPPFCVGNRVYIRSRAFLYCIGNKDKTTKTGHTER
jgi:outer membrane protein assembly factor BamB